VAEGVSKRALWVRARLNTALLATAIVLGGALRFFHLGASELTPDEAASWGAAAAPNVAEVIRRQAQFNPGKLAAYELLLHGWMRMAGDSLLAMRTLSALLGIAAIVLVYWTAREVLALGQRDARSLHSTDDTAAITALIAAVSLIMIRYTREARMYPVLITAVLAQTALLLRARRRGGFANYAGVSVLTVIAIAANFSAIFLFAAQALWLLLSRRGRGEDWGLKCLAALAAAGIVLMPMFGAAVHSSVHALDEGALTWISPPAWWAPVSFFNRGTGTLPFPLLLILAAWGAFVQWPQLHDAIVFALFWIFVPVLILFALSLTVTPLMVERYALSCFVPFFFLAALGISSILSRRIRTGAITLIVALSIAHTGAFLLKPPSLQWTHAIDRMRSYAPAARIAVAPPHGANVLRYYLSAHPPFVVSEFTPKVCANSKILFLWDHALEQPDGKEIGACLATFPRILFEEKDVTVRTR
jgi:mannosyltransferase